MKRSVKLLVLLFLSSALLAGCNTARGVGEDIQGLGHAISRCELNFPAVSLMALASRYVSLLHAYSFSLKNRKDPFIFGRFVYAYRA
ncbi:hypothetical protein BANRA_05275 [Klebsiella pneumoniae]|nr:hypothetical protein BANRA_05275 [Klebsiella pneumoniae]